MTIAVCVCVSCSKRSNYMRRTFTARGRNVFSGFDKNTIVITFRRLLISCFRKQFTYKIQQCHDTKPQLIIWWFCQHDRMSEKLIINHNCALIWRYLSHPVNTQFNTKPILMMFAPRSYLSYTYGRTIYSNIWLPIWLRLFIAIKKTNSLDILW